MKTILTIFFLLYIGVGFTACKKDEDRDKDKDKTSFAEVSAKINGVYWESEGISASLNKSYSNVAPTANNFTLFAYNNEQTEILFFGATDYKDNGQDDCFPMNTYYTVGDNTDSIVWMGDVFYNFAVYNYIEGRNEYTAMVNGHITVSTCNLVDSTINGTFDFVTTTIAGDTVKVTDGKITNLKVSIL